MKHLSLSDFLTRFGTEGKCLAHLVAVRWPDGIPCDACGKVTGHHASKKRRCYDCQECGAQTYPTAGTIFHRTRTPLPVWFYVIWQLSHTRTGIAAKQIERETGVTYKTAWRMCHLIRAAMAEGADGAALFTGTVEVDETYVGARKPRYPRRPGRPRPEDKQPVVGIAQRGGGVRAYVVPDVTRATVLPLIQRHAPEGSTVYTDEYPIYKALPKHGYTHDAVRHKVKQYAKEVVDKETGEILSVHTNTIEGFWSVVKGAVLNVHRGVSRFYLQRYVDELAFRYSHRADERPMFLTMLDRAATSGRPSVKPPPIGAV